MTASSDKNEESSSSADVGKRGGVADYFAILGVGEKLVWKHAQKKSAHEVTDEQEDEAALVERFYREIVEVAIVATEPRPRIIGQSPSMDEANELRSALSSSSLQHRQHVPNSPCYSEATTALTFPESAVAPAPVQLDGFTVVQQTCPAGRNSQQDSASLGGVGSANDSSMSATDLDVSRHGQLWAKAQTFDANLDPVTGLRAELSSKVPSAIETRADGDGRHTPLKGLGRKLGTSLRKLNHIVDDRIRHHHEHRTKFHIGYRRRGPDETDKPAVADLSLRYVRIHKLTACGASSAPDDDSSIATLSTVQSTRTAALKRSLATGAVLAARVAEAGKHKLMEKYRHAKDDEHRRRHFLPPQDASSFETAKTSGADAVIVPLDELVPVPIGFDEWSIPEEYKWLRLTNPSSSLFSPDREIPEREQVAVSKQHKTILISHGSAKSAVDSETSDNSGVGVEAYMENAALRALSPTLPNSPEVQRGTLFTEGENTPSVDESSVWKGLDPDVYLPRLLPGLPPDASQMEGEVDYVYIPILAVRRQRTGDEERYHEDPGVVEISVTFSDSSGDPVLPDDEDDDDADNEEGTFNLINSKSAWSPASSSPTGKTNDPSRDTTSRPLGTPLLLVKRNIPIGFADAAFATQVLDRFPLKNYKGLPLPEEELPMFCYPTGCRLHRACYSDSPLPQYYGFVVKNERGDSIHVSCVSFMEPLTVAKIEQLNKISERRRRVSLAHRRYCEKKERHVAQPLGGPGSSVSDLRSYDEASDTRKNQPEAHRHGGVDSPPSASDTSWRDEEFSSQFLTGFGDMTTFENKTICLISRYPFWTAFRRFLSHLHILSGSSSDLPLERCISHLLLSVPVPKAGGPCVIVPLPALNGPMVLSMPPAKDFPLLDLPFQSLLACLDVPTIVTVVLGFLALERKIIIMSSRPSLVLDGCELLRSLLFPFELCAPYVPRLTEPFMSCLDFPGAIFVGIHDDGTPDGLATIVRNNLPEDSAIVDLDTGEIDCSGDRYEILKQCWGVIPKEARTVLVSEIETLCRDAGIVPGQEPLDSQVDSAFNASLPAGLVVDDVGDGDQNAREPLDDRAVRDAFLRFFCSVLGGYERHLVVPDVDFLVSGNEWFDAQGFLAGAPQDRAPYLGSLVTTQLFQSFIQRRTEDSDVHCLLFDECLVEFHSSPIPYGRLGGDVETVANSDGGPPEMLYSLLVDQCSTEPYHPSWDEDDSRSARTMDSPMRKGATMAQAETLLQGNGDIVTTPSVVDLTEGMRFVYCVDGNPCFPQRLEARYFYPREPQSLLTEVSEMPRPLLARTEREVEEAHRRRKFATTYRGLHNQRRCLWQLPKLMGSHFLGAFLLCIPAQVSQPNLSYDQQSRYLLRALGALRLLRSRQRIVADEAAYRALIAACGRSANDRRMELVKLFGLLRSDGIFPSAVTLGQYTRALAEGYSKRSFGMPDESHGGVEVTVSASKDGRVEVSGRDASDAEGVLNAFDGNLAILEDSGRRWRQRSANHREAASERNPVGNDDRSAGDLSSVRPPRETVPGHRPQRRSNPRQWLPVVTSSSFAPVIHVPSSNMNDDGRLSVDTRLIALWSRTRPCENCSYIPLDEEIQSGWDVVGGESDIPHTVGCPRCGSLLLPMLGYQTMSLSEALIQPPTNEAEDGLPGQISPSQNLDELNHTEGVVGFVTYLDPAALRAGLERYVEAEGEDALERDGLRERDPELFYNFWWYCARFSLPLPLPIASEGALHYCAFAAWDKTIALHGCHSGARALAPLYGLKTEQESLSPAASEDVETLVRKESLGEFPLLARFNLQAICQGDWDNQDLSEILVTLVEACDKRDFKPALECVFRCNKRRLDGQREARNDTPVEFGLSSSFVDAPVEVDAYRTLLYLAKYQCTSFVNVFFPATAKPCKGYHFWCAIGTPLPIFDHLFREAVKRIRNKDSTFTPVHDVSDVALGFRCVFGHII